MDFLFNPVQMELKQFHLLNVLSLLSGLRKEKTGQPANGIHNMLTAKQCSIFPYEFNTYELVENADD